MGSSAPYWKAERCLRSSRKPTGPPPSQVPGELPDDPAVDERKHISDADSIQSWADSASVMRVSRQGPLEVGDTLSIDGPNPGGGDVNSSRRMTLIVEEIHAPITLTWVARDTSGQGTVSRVDSVIQLGDSVRISSTFAVALADSLARADTSSSIAGRLVKGTFQVVVGALRMATQGDLDRLKARLEDR